METTNRLAAFRAMIGQPMSGSPSGLGRWLAGTLQQVDEGRAVATYLIREEMVNPMQTLHGGVASAILDDLCGLTAFTLGREAIYTSVNLAIDFLSPAWLGDTITAEANVIRAGRNILHIEGRLKTAEGKLIAKCTTNLAQVGSKS